jgi:hypothetical protein
MMARTIVHIIVKVPKPIATVEAVDNFEIGCGMGLGIDVSA